MVRMPPKVGPFKSPANGQNVEGAHQAIHSHVDEHGATVKHAQVVTGGAAGGPEQAPVAGPDRPDRCLAGKEARQNQNGAENQQEKRDLGIEPGGPMKTGGGRITKRLHHRHQHHGQQTAGEAYVVEVHAILELICIGGEGREHKADQQAD